MVSGQKDGIDNQSIRRSPNLSKQEIEEASAS